MNIRSNNIFRPLVVAVMVLGILSCSSNMEEYYSGGTGITRNETLFEYLASEEEYSTFAALVEETGMAQKLSGQDLFTVWAPSNDVMPDDISQMSEADKLMLVQNHISVTTIYSRNIATMSTVGTLAGKYLNVSSGAKGFTIDNVNLTEIDMVFKNGLVHKIDGCLVPAKNIYQWLEDLSDDFSIFRDSLKAHDVRTFDKANSEIIGVDDTGKIVYDSLWIVKNDFLNNVDLNDESIRYTLLVPDDATIKSLLDERKSWFDEIEREMTMEDSSAVVTWLMNAALHKGVSEYAPGMTLTSVKGRKLRTDYATVKEPMNMSNGRIYLMDKCYVPRDVHYQTYNFNPYFIRYWMLKVKTPPAVITSNNADAPYDKYYGGINNANSRIREDVKAIVWQYSTNTKDNHYEFEARTWNEEELITEDMPVTPGFYKIRARFIKQGDDFDTDKLNVYQVFEDGTVELIANIEGVKKAYFDTASDNGKTGLVHADWEFKGKYQKVRFRVEIPGSYTTGPKRRLSIGEWALIPNDNY